MFTGIIEEVGIVRSVVRRDAGAVLTIDCHIVLEDIFEGASIAVNGVCLTVTSFTANSFFSLISSSDAVMKSFCIT